MKNQGNNLPGLNHPDSDTGAGFGTEDVFIPRSDRPYFHSMHVDRGLLHRMLYAPVPGECKPCVVEREWRVIGRV